MIRKDRNGDDSYAWFIDLAQASRIWGENRGPVNICIYRGSKSGAACKRLATPKWDSTRQIANVSVTQPGLNPIWGLEFDKRGKAEINLVYKTFENSHAR